MFLLCGLIQHTLRHFPLQPEAGNILPTLCSYPAYHSGQHLMSIALNLSICWENSYLFFFFHIISLLGFPAEVAQLEAAKQPQKGEVRAVAKGGAWPCAYHKVFSCWSGVASLWALKGRYLSTFWELHWKNFGFCQLEDSTMLKLAFFWSCVWLKVFFSSSKKTFGVLDQFGIFNSWFQSYFWKCHGSP